MRVLLLSLSLLIAVASAAIIDDSFVYTDRPLDAVPSQWTHHGRVSDVFSGDAPVTSFYLALPQRDVKGLHDKLMEVSNPMHPTYSQWLSAEDVKQFVASDRVDVDAVLNFLKHDGESTGLIAAELSPAGDSILITATTDYIESKFHTEMHAFTYNKGPDTVFDLKHVGPLYLPNELKKSVEMVFGITNFHPRQKGPAVVKMAEGGNTVGAGGALTNTPISMRALYNMTDADVATLADSQEAFAEANGKEGFGRVSLAQFQALNNFENNTVRHVLGSGAGGYSGRYNDGEANLDIEMLTTLGKGAETNFFIMSGSVGWMYEYTQEIANGTVISEVHSISYGFDEVDQCKKGYYYSECKKYSIHGYVEYIERTNTEFMKLTSQGQTFVDASGDAGVAGDGSDCYDGKSVPEYPETCPYMIIVGSTVAVAGSGPTLNTTGWSDIPICQKTNCNPNTDLEATMTSNYGGFDSGGGFSFVTPMPSWQTTAVQAYFNSGVTLPDASSYNATNRAFPDVAAIGGSVAVIENPGGGVNLIGGTSASTPEFAGMITTLNSARKAAGKSTLGFVNPLIYEMGANCPSCYFDVSSGFNGQYASCKNAGFTATQGWDAVTGWGHMNYGAWKEYVLGLP
eukprot:TRINITY_DN10779_c0_g1_i1.p1 TRINITY_DN10779_c0_g1~~TRINITY_DN10779_c0_g1_i1.p1  ORF type:complete len:627 (-),score=183.11 TRINITY_DN10779_c0_g1_i1:64-1944(-)